ncbi:Ribosomal protein L24e [Trichostrongylus colubriformis]|uniref:Large ribosomal subunit protein eL24 n=1 Tax=Trichostrongylus colubriformis TaxID=6319 RepID=A0AAN8IY22_TRICO
MDKLFFFDVLPGPDFKTGKRSSSVHFKVQIFLSAKAFRSTKLKRSPRDIRWTVLYRIKHKKGSYGQENVQRKKVKKATHTLNRAVAGMSLEAILAKRNQTSDFRRQQREQAAKAAKEANKAARAAKAAMNKEKKPVPQKVKPPKPVKAAAPRVGGKR